MKLIFGLLMFFGLAIVGTTAWYWRDYHQVPDKIEVTCEKCKEIGKKWRRKE